MFYWEKRPLQQAQRKEKVPNQREERKKRAICSPPLSRKEVASPRLKSRGGGINRKGGIGGLKKGKRKDKRPYHTRWKNCLIQNHYDLTIGAGEGMLNGGEQMGAGTIRGSDETIWGGKEGRCLSKGRIHLIKVL